MNEPKDVFIEILNNIEKNSSLSLKKIADIINTNENRIKPIIDIYLKYNFIDHTDYNQTYKITKIGKDYIKIKS